MAQSQDSDLYPPDPEDPRRQTNPGFQDPSQYRTGTPETPGALPPSPAPNPTGNTGGTVNGSVGSPTLAPSPGAAPSAPGAFDRTAFRDAWQSQGAGQTGESLQRFIAGHPEFSMGVQQSGAHGDVVTLPTGERLDLIGDVGGQGGASWSGADLGGVGSSAPQAGVGGPSLYQTGTPTAAGAPGSGGAGAPGVDAQMRQSLLDLMQRSGGQVDPNSAQVHAVTDPYHVVQQRGLEQIRRQNAEAAYAQGMRGGGGADQGALQQQQTQAGERAATSEAQFTGQAVLQQDQARRQDLTNALQIANAVGARDQAAQIQRELAAIDERYRYAALSQQGNQFNASLGQRASEFNDNYGLSRLGMENDQNRNALLAALGG